MTVIREQKANLELIRPLIEALTSNQLKSTYILAQAVVFEAVDKPENQSRSIELLSALKEI